MEWDAILSKGSPLIIVLYILIRSASLAWKFYTERMYPDSKKEVSDQKKREDRLFQVIENNAQAWTELKVTLLAIKEELIQQNKLLTTTASAVDKKAILYELLQKLLETPGAKEKLGDAIPDLKKSI